MAPKIKWSSRKLTDLRRLSEESPSTLDGMMATAELAIAEGHLSLALPLVEVVRDYSQRDRTEQSHLEVKLLHLLILMGEWQDAGEVLSKRHSVPCRVKINVNTVTRWRDIVEIIFNLPDHIEILLDPYMFSVDKTDVQILALDWIFPVFAAYARYWRGDNGRLLFSNGDDAVVPGLAMCSNRRDTFLIPDSVFVPSHGYRAAKADIIHCALPWHMRKPVAFWRGATTGRPSVPQQGWRSLPRVRLCEISAENPDVLDAGITSVIQIGDTDAERAICELGLRRPFVPINSFNDFKYQIDIDGNTNSWPGLFQKLIGGGTVLKVGSNYDYKQWYYDRLIPWTNYVPVDPDMNDLVEKIDWLRDRDEYARLIGLRGRELALSIDYDKEMTASSRVVESALRYFGLRPYIDVDLNGPRQQDVCLIDGWATVHEAGLFSAGRESRLMINLAACLQGIELELDVEPACLDETGPQRLGIVVNGDFHCWHKISSRTQLRQPLEIDGPVGSVCLAVTLLHPDAKIIASPAHPLQPRNASIRLHHVKVVASKPSIFARLAQLPTLDEQAPNAGGSRALTTASGTILYVDVPSGQLRHGPPGSVVENLTAILVEDAAMLVFRQEDGRLTRLGQWPFECDIDDGTATRKDSSPFKETYVVIRQSEDTFALRSADRFLCADDHGSVTLSRQAIGSWETFSLKACAH